MFEQALVLNKRNSSLVLSSSNNSSGLFYDDEKQLNNLTDLSCLSFLLFSINRTLQDHHLQKCEKNLVFTQKRSHHIGSSIEHLESINITDMQNVTSFFTQQDFTSVNDFLSKLNSKDVITMQNINTTLKTHLISNNRFNAEVQISEDIPAKQLKSILKKKIASSNQKKKVSFETLEFKKICLFKKLSNPNEIHSFPVIIEEYKEEEENYLTMLIKSKSKIIENDLYSIHLQNFQISKNSNIQFDNFNSSNNDVKVYSINVIEKCAKRDKNFFIYGVFKVKNVYMELNYHSSLNKNFDFFEFKIDISHDDLIVDLNIEFAIKFKFEISSCSSNNFEWINNDSKNFKFGLAKKIKMKSESRLTPTQITTQTKSIFNEEILMMQNKKAENVTEDVQNRHSDDKNIKISTGVQMNSANSSDLKMGKDLESSWYFASKRNLLISTLPSSASGSCMNDFNFSRVTTAKA
ncbi:hypothetical protein HK099_007491 [Clydaea vesicula]|uniref:Uncharacterized protein n=1 Tax=Clydaea vesicula TaxID=447962 RepID=A0AAD5U5E2_9FUNG|nr:hypothetical protein HK099_007491 [Clydaea vesicula]